MSYPTAKPSSRSYNHGDWPVKTFKAMNGAEVRIMYGNRRTGSTFSLNYQNVPDSVADDFLTHYNEMLGTYTAFPLPPQVLAGWTGALEPFDPQSSLRFRYSEPPSVDAVKPGVSTVSVNLVGVLL